MEERPPRYQRSSRSSLEDQESLASLLEDTSVFLEDLSGVSLLPAYSHRREELLGRMEQKLRSFRGTPSSPSSASAPPPRPPARVAKPAVPAPDVAEDTYYLGPEEDNYLEGESCEELSDSDDDRSGKEARSGKRSKRNTSLPPWTSRLLQRSGENKNKFMKTPVGKSSIKSGSSSDFSDSDFDDDYNINKARSPASLPVQKEISSQNIGKQTKKSRRPWDRKTETDSDDEFEDYDVNDEENTSLTQTSKRRPPPSLPITRRNSATNSSAMTTIRDDDVYDSVQDLLTTSQAERRTNLILALPTGHCITSAKILNANADFVGWLWRKRGLFRDQERLWAIVYQSRLYLYNDSKDTQEREHVELAGSDLQKHKKGRGFMISVKVMKKTGKTKITKNQFETSDTELAKQWISKLEDAINNSNLTKSFIRQNSISSEEEDESDEDEASYVDDDDYEPVTTYTKTQPPARPNHIAKPLPPLPPQRLTRRLPPLHHQDVEVWDSSEKTPWTRTQSACIQEIKEPTTPASGPAFRSFIPMKITERREQTSSAPAAAFKSGTLLTKSANLDKTNISKPSIGKLSIGKPSIGKPLLRREKSATSLGANFSSELSNTLARMKLRKT